MRHSRATVYRPSAAAASLESPRGFCCCCCRALLSACLLLLLPRFVVRLRGCLQLGPWWRTHSGLQTHRIMAVTGPLSMGVPTLRVLSCKPFSPCVCLPVCLSVCLSVSVCCCMSIGRPVRLVPLVLSCCSSRLATWSASVGCSLVTTRTGDAERGRLHPPTRAGLCRSATRGREGGPGGGCVGGLRHPAYTLARTPLGRLLIAVGRAAPLSVAWLPLAGFLLPSSPLPQVAEAVGAGEAMGGFWSSILFSLDVAAGL